MRDHDRERRRGDGSHAWVGMLLTIAFAAGFAAAIVFAVRRWWVV